MALMKAMEYAEAPAAVKAVYEDIMRTRNTDWINKSK